ncbi:MAG: CpsD/CapB family tyrosine-protein kinase [Clostridium sulfidigenes]|uniref:non-specific protein-tyrosine kinase n=1 Tax=Clostridium sulfidigenes TaxID=318464 RepID=A0A927W733_9CLOT|nr:CpsD/CapB family tyrosine-protein kinase [Clostridium sulfidigenes]
MFIVEKEPKSIAAESYRTLRTNIQYSSFDKEYRVIVVTSSEPGEGKSTTTGNLALSMAQGDKKVILIDCDLRKPSLHKKFKVSNLVGLSDVMIGKADLATAAHRYNKNLVLLTSGKIPPNPSEMLSSKAMTSLLEVLKESFDYIIIDTPPVQAVTDSQILSTKADGTILVVRAERTKKESVQNAVNLLKKVNANIIGTVLNGVDASRNKYYYYYGESK